MNAIVVETWKNLGNGQLVMVVFVEWVGEFLELSATGDAREC